MTNAWDSFRLKHLVRCVVEKAETNVDFPYVGLESIASWIGKIDISTPNGTEEAVGNKFQPGDILFGKLRPYLAKVAIADFYGQCSGEALVLRPITGVDKNFLRYRMVEVGTIDTINASTYGTKMPRASWEFIGNIVFSIPDLPTQKAIAAFLDRETARIDLLIDKKEKFRELIKEKRKSLMAGLVDGSLLNGGERTGFIGWFGQIPVHWEKIRARFLFREHIDPSQDGSEELLTVSHITGVTARAEKDVNMFMAETLEGYKLVQENDLIVNTMWAWMGAIGVSPIDGCVSPSYAVYRPSGDILIPDYLDLVVRSLPFIAEVNRRSKGVWASRLRLYPDAFLDIQFPLPPMAEQRALLNAVNSQVEREENIVSISEKSITLLREYRAALITAAVTGQIDVATWGREGRTERRLDQIEEATQP